MSTPFVIRIEIGGQELECSGRKTKAYPQTLTQPAEPSELEVEKIELLIGVEGNRRRLLDITDLVEELGGLDLVQQTVEEDYEPEPDGPDEDSDDYRHFL